ncbi:hypothetical protein ABL78_6689 [Leptomonas seymouri]|uniref:Uncharacterized protein n=1 Tax=Leptomonas seymouri TaxID=5684 RepID=A0A0N1IIM8_LEPSE|nr:hypothetical protein ABL78_6689 [Leptomonas seymouri]|eukprot:KPI84255.1 hypothetical protein ABL78_6689 [Leptomonas seymouri]
MSDTLENAGAAVGVRTLKRFAFDSSSSSNSDGIRADGAKPKHRASTLRAKPLGGAAKTRPRSNSSSSLELSTSSSRSSSSSDSPALPAAFRKAAAMSAAAREALRKGNRSSSGNAEDDGPPLQSQSIGRGEAAAVSASPAAALFAAASGELSQQRQEGPPIKTTVTMHTASHRGSDAAVAEAPPTQLVATTPPAARTMESETINGSSASASAPTFHSGSNFFFKRRDTFPPCAGDSAAQESSAPAAVSQSTVRVGRGDEDNSACASRSNDLDFKGQHSPTAITAPARVPGDEERRGPPSTSILPSVSAARVPQTYADGPSAASEQPSHTTATIIDTPSPSSSTAAAAMKRLSFAIKTDARASSSSSSSPPSTPRRASAPRRAAAKFSPSSPGILTLPSTLTPAAPPAPPRSQSHAFPMETAAAESKRVAVASPPVVEIRKVSLELDSDGEWPAGSRAPSSSLATQPTKSTVAPPASVAVVGAAAAKSSAPVAPSGASRTDTSLLAKASAAPDIRARGAGDTTANHTATTTTNASSPMLSGPSGHLIYNRISVRGIGSVPACVIEAPPRPKRRALPSEHTISGTAAAAALTPKRGAFPSAGKSTPEAEGEAQTDVRERAGGEKQPSARALATPAATVASSHRPQREAPRTPTSRGSPPLTLLDDGDVGAIAAGTPATGAAPTQAPEEPHQAPARLTSPSRTKDMTSSFSLPSSSSPPRTYLARSATAAALQRQREAALVIYDDRVPPERRIGCHAQPFASFGAAARSRDPVTAWMALGAPSRDERARGTVSRTGRSLASDVNWRIRTSTLDGHPVLHVGGSRHDSFALLCKPGQGPQRGELREVDRAEAQERAAEAREATTHHRRLSLLRSQSPRTVPGSLNIGAKTHVSDAVVQQLLQHYERHTQRKGGNRADPITDSFLDDVPRSMTAGRVDQKPRRDVEGAKTHGAAAKRLSSRSTRIVMGEVEGSGVDLLNYRDTRSH